MSCKVTFSFVKGPCLGQEIVHEFDGQATVFDMKKFLTETHHACADSQFLYFVWVEQQERMTDDGQKVFSLGQNASITVTLKNRDAEDTSPSCGDLICLQRDDCGVPLKVTGLLNASGVPMTLPVVGSDLISITKSSPNPNFYYCSRILGREAIPGSDGQCGPSNGPQCKDCKAAQDFYMSRQMSTSVTPGPCLPSYAFINSSTMQNLQVVLGDHIKMQSKADERPMICTVTPDNFCPLGSVRLSPHTCAKLSLRLGDTVRVQVCNVSFARRVMYRFVGPAPSMQLAHETISFRSCCVSAEDMFRFRVAGVDFNVRIMCTDPEGVCMVTSDSEIFCESSFSDEDIPLLFPHVVDSSPLVPDSKPTDFPSRGDLICLQRDDGTTSTLLRKRATSSRCIFSRVIVSLTISLTPDQRCI